MERLTYTMERLAFGEADLWRGLTYREVDLWRG